MNLFRFVRIRPNFTKPSQRQRRKLNPIRSRLRLEELESRVLLSYFPKFLPLLVLN
jgi:hypothetical protein